MTQTEASVPRNRDTDLSQIPECPTGRWWVCALLGVVMLAGGVFVLFNIVAASLATALFFAAALIVSGGFQIAHSFAARGWKSVTLSLVVGILFVAGGALLATNPLATSLGLTLGIAAMMLASGVVRLVLAFRHWNDFGWLLLGSGLLGIALGVVLILGFPFSGLVLPGMLLGIDLLLNGTWWLVLGYFVRRPREGSIMAQPAKVAG
jgi:uncharacterized membrane protein HdeD (DUF308 family)